MRKLLFILAVALPLVAQTRTEITRASVLAQMNRARAGAGLAPLHEDGRLDAAAEDRMKDMEDLGYFAHVSPDGRPPFVWLKPHGYNYSNAGENLAAGFETAEVLMDSWMESPGHRDNILNPLYQDCGVAIIDGSTKGRGTGRSIVVLFGRPLVNEIRLQASSDRVVLPRP
ncbi:MAG TPA: CAP domain-containing protein [Thermoanaerobaculia bacterium]|nr:CAP domain-containing protein [Thermoanaerobaculia bacterium]